MSLFLSSELRQVDAAHKEYALVKQRADYMQTSAKRRVQLLFGKPSVLFGIFAAGAFKGLTTNNPKSKRKTAINSFIRTAFFQLIN